MTAARSVYWNTPVDAAGWHRSMRLAMDSHPDLAGLRLTSPREVRVPAAVNLAQTATAAMQAAVAAPPPDEARLTLFRSSEGTFIVLAVNDSGGDPVTLRGAVDLVVRQACEQHNINSQGPATYRQTIGSVPTSAARLPRDPVWTDNEAPAEVAILAAKHLADVHPMLQREALIAAWCTAWTRTVEPSPPDHSNLNRLVIRDFDGVPQVCFTERTGRQLQEGLGRREHRSDLDQVQTWFGQGPPQEVTDSTSSGTYHIQSPPARSSRAIPILWLGPGEGAVPSIQMEYDPTRLTPRVAARLLRRVDVLAARIVAEPDIPLTQIDVITDEERRLIEESNDTATRRRESCIHQLFEEQAERTPDAISVTANDVHLTYAELNRRSNQVAAGLHRCGVRTEDLVAVAADRRVETIIAMLGILKAGGAYVPVATDQPQERTLRILGDAKPALFISQLDDLNAAVGDSGVPAAKIDRLQVHGVDHDRLTVPRLPDSLAYVIYTSGSTGIPKGVCVTHRQLVNSTAARWADGRFSPGAYAPPVPLSFDASAAAIYWCLTRGGRLVLPSDAQAKDPMLFARLIHSERITHITGMASFYSLVLMSDPHLLTTLRDAAIGGEVMPVDLVREHQRTVPEARLWNDYGPTEGTIWSTAHACTGAEDGATVPIGLPIENVQIHLVDEHLGLVPPGTIGQIAIAGSGIARGYLHRPAQTAEVFVPNPYGMPGERMYLSADLGIREPNGEIRFVGRADQQIKIRGFRVEPAEIETALRDHPGVHAAAVSTRESPGKQIGLQAVVIPADPDSPPTQESLRAHLKALLPHYMIPDHISFSDRLPRDSTGKLTRHCAHALNSPQLTALSESQIDALVTSLLPHTERS